MNIVSSRAVLEVTAILHIRQNLRLMKLKKLFWSEVAPDSENDFYVYGSSVCQTLDVATKGWMIGTNHVAWGGRHGHISESRWVKWRELRFDKKRHAYVLAELNLTLLESPQSEAAFRHRFKVSWHSLITTIIKLYDWTTCRASGGKRQVYP